MTTKATHTPGPWTVSANLNSRLPYSVEGNGWTVARIVRDEHLDKPDEEPEANARLIAAAPEMLALLRSFMSKVLTLDGMEYLDDERDEARALLARIDGHPETTR